MGEFYNVPWQVQRLMKEEEMRNLRNFSENAVKLRAMYARMLEDALDAEGHREHWGKTLEWKILHFERKARETMLSWARINKIPDMLIDKYEIRNEAENLYLGFQGILAEK